MNKTVLSGVILTSVAYFLFSLQDAAVKLLVTDLPVFQILFVRSVVILCICLAVGRKKVVIEAVSSPVLVPLFIRNLLLLGAWLAFYSAARDLGLAELTTVYYASPVLITILAVPILKEHVPAIRWVAVVFGFVGVVIACNPIGNGMTLSVPVCLALLAAVFWACSTVLLRKTAMDERTSVQMLISCSFFIVITGIAGLFLWTPVMMPELGLMAATGALAGVAQFAFFESMRRAPVSILAPFEYTSLIWAFILGFAIWGEIPANNVFVGAVLIFGAGGLILFGERFIKGLAAKSATQERR